MALPIKGDILFKRNTENTPLLKQEISLRHELCKKSPSVIIGQLVLFESSEYKKQEDFQICTFHSFTKILQNTNRNMFVISPQTAFHLIALYLFTWFWTSSEAVWWKVTPSVPVILFPFTPTIIFFCSKYFAEIQISPQADYHSEKSPKKSPTSSILIRIFRSSSFQFCLYCVNCILIFYPKIDFP